MKAKITKPFNCYYCGEKLVFAPGAIVEGWPAKQAIAKGCAAPYTPKKKKAAPENKALEAEESKASDGTAS
jgi:hypothetical protein